MKNALITGGIQKSLLDSVPEVKDFITTMSKLGFDKTVQNEEYMEGDIYLEKQVGIHIEDHVPMFNRNNWYSDYIHNSVNSWNVAASIKHYFNS